MKRINQLFLTLVMLFYVSAYPQLKERETVFYEEQYKNLQIGYSKTTSIVFPYSIKSVDKGSADVLVQKAKGVENILLVKAAKQYFFQTNLTVVTTDARLYVFVLNYDDNCPDLNINAENAVAASKDVLFSMEHENQKKIEQLASLALSKKKKTSGLKKSKFQIRLEVNGIFIHQDVLYLRVVLENKSKINYDIDQLRFFIRDQRKSKRTASQEIEILPLYTTSSSAVIPYKSEVIKVYAVEKFTIPENKYLTLQLIEKNGGRHLEVNINNLSDKAFPIPASGSNDF
ncbi:conjugative transposon protein TraN [Flavobacterium sp. KBS0721]|uniref:conjugative transposon protein TraN n=1 Tax=Flavobacterium sp. KBS0721 TaxID=1179672 RepID=UPI0009901417|nr:conjugative transposon protein TraN [Flavobacterium sp. KBS0721]QDW21206.1 conjugative transposon protein TraN [Flavobacterium sp. KBS0721]